MSNSKIVNGYGGSRIAVLGVDNGFFEFPTCNKSGMIEHILKESVSYTLWVNGRTEEKIRGYRKKFVLNFDEFVEADTLMMFKAILEWEIQGKKIILYPRAMNLNYYYEVYSTSTDMMIRILSNGVNAGGMKGFIIEFTSKELTNNIGWVYAQNFNTILQNQLQLGL